MTVHSYSKGHGKKNLIQLNDCANVTAPTPVVGEVLTVSSLDSNGDPLFDLQTAGASLPNNEISQLDSSVIVTDTGSNGLITVKADNVTQVEISTAGTDLKNAKLGCNGNFGSNGDVLTRGATNCSWAAPASAIADKIEEGNTSVECIDAGVGAGAVKIDTNGSERVDIDVNGTVNIGNAVVPSSTSVKITSGGYPLEMIRSGYDSYGYEHSTGAGIAFRNITDARNELMYDGAGNVEVVKPAGLVMSPKVGIASSAFYSEGYWTATMVAAGSGTITVNPGYATMGYIKIGRMCWIHGEFNISAISSPTGTAQIHTLPFAVQNGSTTIACGGFVSIHNYSGDHRTIAARPQPASTHVYLYSNYGQAGAYDGQTANYFTASTQVSINMCYPTAT